MPTEITEQKILQALESVAMPSQNTSLSASGAISGIVIKGGNIGFTIEIAPELAAEAEALKTSAKKAVEAVEGVLSVTVLMTAHRKAEASAPPAAPQAPQQQDVIRPAAQVIAVASGKGAWVNPLLRLIWRWLWPLLAARSAFWTPIFTALHCRDYWA